MFESDLPLHWVSVINFLFTFTNCTSFKYSTVYMYMHYIPIEEHPMIFVFLKLVY